jgi:phosphopantetheine--protein transferase-like protein
MSEIINFLSTLLNRPITADMPIRLSSAQRARFNAWLHSRGYPLADSQLKGDFILQKLNLSANGCEKAIYPVKEHHSEGENEFKGCIGIDLQSVDEISNGINVHDFKSDETLIRMFTDRELSYAQTKPNAVETLAGLWAAKEAIRKCADINEFSLDRMRELEILPDHYGKPQCNPFSISISHSAGFAVAVAIKNTELITNAQREKLGSLGDPNMQNFQKGSGLVSNEFIILGLLAFATAIFVVLKFNGNI